MTAFGPWLPIQHTDFDGRDRGYSRPYLLSLNLSAHDPYLPSTIQNSCIAAIYSITASASASSLTGTSRPSVLAVLRLIMSSNLVGCVTGMSAGFSPLRTRPA